MRGSRIGIFANNLMYDQFYDNKYSFHTTLNMAGTANATQLNNWNGYTEFEGFVYTPFTSYLFGTATIKPKYYNNEEFPYIRLSEGVGTSGGNGSILAMKNINFGTFSRTGLNASDGTSFALSLRPNVSAYTAGLWIFSIISYLGNLAVNNIRLTKSGNELVLTNVNSTLSYSPTITTTDGLLATNNVWRNFIVRVRRDYMELSYSNPNGVITILGTSIDPTKSEDILGTSNSAIAIGSNLGSNVPAMDIRLCLIWKKYLLSSEVNNLHKTMSQMFNMTPVA